MPHVPVSAFRFSDWPMIPMPWCPSPNWYNIVDVLVTKTPNALDARGGRLDRRALTLQRPLMLPTVYKYTRKATSKGQISNLKICDHVSHISANLPLVYKI